MRALKLSLFACALSLFASPLVPTAHALLTYQPPPGVVHTYYPVGESYGQAGIEPSLGGSILYDDLVPITCTSKGASFSAGTMQVRMVLTGANSIDYYWRVTSVESGRTINTIRVSSVGTVPLDADFRLDGIGAWAPSYIHREVGHDIVFDFTPGGPLTHGQDSRLLFIRDSRALGAGGWVNGGFTVTVSEASSGLTCSVAAVGPNPAL